MWPFFTSCTLRASCVTQTRASRASSDHCCPPMDSQTMRSQSADGPRKLPRLEPRTFAHGHIPAPETLRGGRSTSELGGLRPHLPSPRAREKDRDPAPQQPHAAALTVETGTDTVDEAHSSPRPVQSTRRNSCVWWAKMVCDGRLPRGTRGHVRSHRRRRPRSHVCSRARSRYLPRS